MTVNARGNRIGIIQPEPGLVEVREKWLESCPPVVAVRGIAGPADDAMALDARSSLTLYLNGLGPRPKKAAEWQEEIEKELRRWFRREHGRRPVVVGATLEV